MSVAQRWGPLAGALLLTLPGCPQTNGPGPRVRPRKRPLTRIRAIQITGRAPQPKRPVRVSPLPPFPRFREAVAPTRRSLEQTRKLAYRTQGARRQKLITGLAALLWQMANQKVDRIRALQAAAQAAGRAVPKAQVDPLKRQVALHLRECVFLLEAVVESRHAPPVARVRLAHYLRSLQPAKAAGWFVKLLAAEKSTPRRRRYALDLAQLRLGLGQPRRARKVLRAHARIPLDARERLLHALALTHGGGSRAQVAEALGLLVRSLPKAPAAVRRSAIAQLPAMLARLDRPAARLRSWARGAPTPSDAEGRAVTTGLVWALVKRGELGLARRVLTVASKLSIPVSPSAAKWVLHLSGERKPAARPLHLLGWQAHVRARLPSLSTCGLGGKPWTLALRVLPSGRVTVTSVRSGAPRARTGAPASGPVRSCVNRQLRRWRFPPWRQAGYVRLVVVLRARAGRPFASLAALEATEGEPKGQVQAE